MSYNFIIESGCSKLFGLSCIFCESKRPMRSCTFLFDDDMDVFKKVRHEKCYRIGGKNVILSCEKHIKQFDILCRKILIQNDINREIIRSVESYGDSSGILEYYDCLVIARRKFKELMVTHPENSV